MRNVKAIVVWIGIFLFLTFWNLPQQYSFTQDSARDTLASLQLLHNPDITFIGPPLSFGQYGLRETYFSSLIYYVGAFSIWFMSKLPFVEISPALAPVIAIALLNASGIIPLYMLLKKYLGDKKNVEIQLIMAAFVTNPIVINYSRIFWNPSPLIGLGLWSLLALNVSPILFGILIGIAFYFHYFAVILLPIGMYLYLRDSNGKSKSIRSQQWKKVFQTMVAFACMLLPILFFESRNEMYLLKSFMFNVQNGALGGVSSNKMLLLLTAPISLIGLTQDYFGQRVLLLVENPMHVSVFAILVSLFLWTFVLWIVKKEKKSLLFVLPLIFAIFVSKEVIRLQYLFIGFGALFIYGLPELFSSKKFNRNYVWIVLGFLILIQMCNTLYGISQQASIGKNTQFPTVQELESAVTFIKSTHEDQKAFNVTENIIGDARALYMRFFIEEDNSVVHDLQNELTYENLDELYVLTPSVEKTSDESRWEFQATSGLTLTDQARINNDYLILYFKHASEENP